MAESFLNLTYEENALIKNYIRSLTLTCHVQQPTIQLLIVEACLRKAHLLYALDERQARKLCSDGHVLIARRLLPVVEEVEEDVMGPDNRLYHIVTKRTVTASNKAEESNFDFHQRKETGAKKSKPHDCDEVCGSVTSRKRRLTLPLPRSRHWGGQRAPRRRSSFSW